MPDGSQRTLADAVPFREVYIHALVRDADRQKMSKTKGNVIDPIDIIHRYGTDAVRFTLASMASPGTDIAFSEARTEGYRAFANKIWNAARFIFMQMDRAKEAGIVVDLHTLAEVPVLTNDSPIEAFWITSQLNLYAKQVNLALTDYRFDDAANLIYRFFWGGFCDWYLEIVKIRLDFSETADKQQIEDALSTVLSTFETGLRLLSPFMPFLTEELWRALYDGRPPLKSIALAQYPKYDVNLVDQTVEAHMISLQLIIAAIRARRKELGIEESVSVPVMVTEFPNMPIPTGNLIENNRSIIQRLAKVSKITVFPIADSLPDGKYGHLMWSPAGPIDIYIDYEKPIDIPAERERLTKDLAKYEKEMQSKQSQLQNDGFLAKAPAKIVDGLRTRADELTVLIEKTRAALDSLDTVGSR
jgi:valyl-tRNA synthetase